jgi:hypothetical protein
MRCQEEIVSWKPTHYESRFPGIRKLKCKHLENRTIAWELRHGFRENVFTKNSNGTLGDGDLYYGRMTVTKDSAFVTSKSSRDQSVIQTAVRDSSQKFVRQTSFRRSSICEL